MSKRKMLNHLRAISDVFNFCCRADIAQCCGTVCITLIYDKCVFKKIKEVFQHAACFQSTTQCLGNTCDGKFKNIFLYFELIGAIFV